MQHQDSKTPPCTPHAFPSLLNSPVNNNNNPPKKKKKKSIMPLKTILITGCSSGGIGSALALTLATRGHHVFATARNPSKISDALTSLSNVTILPLDVTSTESVAAAAKSVADSGRGLDVLVNNAGMGEVRPILDWDVGEAQGLFDTNFWGVVRTVQAFAGLLVERRGRVVNVSSVGGVVNVPWHGLFFPSSFSPPPSFFFCYDVYRRLGVMRR